MNSRNRLLEIESAFQQTRLKRTRKFERKESMPRVNASKLYRRPYHQALSAPPAQQINYTVPVPISVIPQPTTRSCWAAVTTMLLSWRDELTYDIPKLLEKIGKKWLDLFNKNQVLPFKDHPVFLAAAGLIAETPQSFSVKGWESLLRTYGPIWVTSDEQLGYGTRFHARVVIGIQGDGTPKGTFLKIIDPDRGRQRQESVAHFVQKYEEVVKELNDTPIQVVHLPVNARKTTTSSGKTSLKVNNSTSQALLPDAFAKGGDDSDWYSDDILGTQQAVSSYSIEDYSVASGMTRADVQWATDSKSPDYRHLEVSGMSGAFTLTGDTIAKLARANAFDVKAGQDEVLFGLRGCRLIENEATNFVSSIQVEEDIPDHYDFHCVLGVWKRSTNQIAVFKGSTVPNWRHMEIQRSQGGQRANMLVSGRYIYRVGQHRAVQGAFIQQRNVVVMRSNEDLSYEISDVFERHSPADNIHPAFRDRAAKFSSAGCSTIPGTWNASNGHQGNWALFRQRAGLDPNNNRSKWDARYIYLILTGREARLISEGVTTDSLKRLRFGSSGANVEALQLGLEQEGLYKGKTDGVMGQNTVWAYIRWQQKNQNGDADGIVTPDAGKLLGFDLANNISIQSALNVSYSYSGLSDHARPFETQKGQVFQPADIERMKKFLETNATCEHPKSCIGTMNQALRLLLNNSSQKVGSEVHTTMEALRKEGHASAPHVVEFLNKSGKKTTGVSRPESLHVSILNALLQINQKENGWSVFGMSLMDGYHSVLLTLDNTDPANPKIYWSDQWRSKGGWKAYTKDSLDTEVTSLTQGWWDQQPANRKHKTRVTLWRVLP